MPNKKITKTCESCGKSFIANRPEGRFCTKGCGKKGDKSYNWKGENVSLKVLHKWISRILIRPKCCSKCGTTGKVDLANKSNEYRRDVSDWEWLCRKCHMESDGRLDEFLKHSISKRLPLYTCPVCNELFKPPNTKSKHCSRSCSNKSRVNKLKN